jgi:2-dehydro-3-deoxyglucarate aldolase
MTAAMPSQALTNSFRRAVCGGETRIGCWAPLASPIVTELLCIVGFDWMLLYADDAPNEVLTLISHS